MRARVTPGIRSVCGLLGYRPARPQPTPSTEIGVPKAKTLRVHSLAKELGVTSKQVIEKCRAEGIELKNHMAAISFGLAESIREVKEQCDRGESGKFRRFEQVVGDV